MAAKTPQTTKSTTGWIDPDRGIHNNTGAAAMSKEGLKHQCFFFGAAGGDNDVDNTDTWASGISGIVAVAAHCATAAKGVRATFSGSTITFESFDTSGDDDDLAVYLHVWSQA